MRSAHRFTAASLAALLALAGCALRQARDDAGGFVPQTRDDAPLPALDQTGGAKIKHIVLMIQENRTFNNLFAGFPHTKTSLTGVELVKQGGGYVRKTVNLAKADLTFKGNIVHLYDAFLTAWQNGDMDGFNLIKYQSNGQPEGLAPYQYVDPSQISAYRTLAARWGLADKMFQTQGSDSFTAHQDLIRGGTFINATESLIDPPTSPEAWGCDSSPGSKTSLITTDLKFLPKAGPFPCTKNFPGYGSGGYQTLRDLLDAKSLSWKYYAPAFAHKQPNGLWNAFDMIAPVRYGPEWTNNISSPPQNVLADIKHGKLAAMSWVIPDAANSDHPGYAAHDTGPSWVASVTNTIGQSKYWNSTVIVVVWDDWGGFYDPVPPPPQDNQGGPGFRVPMIVISPYVRLGSDGKAGYVSHTLYSFGSIVRFIEDTFALGRLGTTDSTCKSIGNMFNFNQKARKYTKVQAEYSPSYFLRQRASGLPVDTD